jgi:hypothetical protein
MKVKISKYDSLSNVFMQLNAEMQDKLLRSAKRLLCIQKSDKECFVVLPVSTNKDKAESKRRRC